MVKNKYNFFFLLQAHFKKIIQEIRMDDGRFDDAEEDITRPVNLKQNKLSSKAVSLNQRI